MKRLMTLCAALAVLLLSGCSTAQSPHRDPHTPVDGEVQTKKQDVSGAIARDLLMKNLRETRGISDDIVHDAKRDQEVGSDRQLRLQSLKEQRDEAFKELKHYRGMNAANATTAILDANDVAALAVKYANTVRDGGAVKPAAKRYDAVVETLTEDVNYLYKALTVPRH